MVRDTLYAGNEQAYEISTGIAATCGDIGLSLVKNAINKAAEEAFESKLKKELTEQAAKTAAKEAEDVAEKTVQNSAKEALKDTVKNNVDDAIEEATEAVQKNLDDVVKDASGVEKISESGTHAFSNAEDLKMSQTVQNHMNDVIKKGPNAGQLSRPYIDSNGTTLLLKEIMESADPVPDAILQSGLRWDVSGTFRGSTGIWELVVDISTYTVVHFNFVTQ